MDKHLSLSSLIVLTPRRAGVLAGQDNTVPLVVSRAALNGRSPLKLSIRPATNKVWFRLTSDVTPTLLIVLPKVRGLGRSIPLERSNAASAARATLPVLGTFTAPTTNEPAGDG